MTHPPSSKAILCAGRLYCDLVFTGAPNLPVLGTETFAEGLSLHAGGGVFISAAAFSALGWETAILATFPAAPFDTIVRRDIEEFALNTKHCAEASPQSAPQITVAITANDDRAFLSHKSGAALPDITLNTGDYRHLHIGELRTLVEHPDLIDKARAADMTISVDCGWDDDIISRGAELADLLARVDVFLPNETEYDHLSQSGLSEGTAPLTVVKCGSKGARAFSNGTWSAASTTPANVVDATGAGDAFNGGFLSCWLQGKPIETCLNNGNLCGRSSVEQAGGTGGLRNLQRDLTGAAAE